MLMHLFLNMRWAQKLDRERRFDALLGTDNECDFGRPGLQYVNYPWALLPRPAEEIGWYHRIPGFLEAYRFACGSISGVSVKRVRRNGTLVNSEFASSLFRQAYGRDSTVLHPPVPGDFAQTTWETRRESFVGVGRIHPHKRWVDAVHILDSVRARGREIGLTVIGHSDDEEYGREIRRLQESRPWFVVLNNLSRHELVSELSCHRYGIHTTRGEHFGIGPAELLRASCLTFVHNSGGPVEIVGKRQELLFDNPEDAVEKICRVLRDEGLRKELRAHIAVQREVFGAERFCESLRTVVNDFATLPLADHHS